MKLNIGDNIKINLESLVDTRLLVQANSGGGKSWAIRKLLEESHGHVQQIVLDIEGEFATLREKYDYILAGKGGDVAANPRTAELLARRVLELSADIIIDLYELKQHERIRFVRLFLDAMINAPKDLWHQVLVVVDEAHLFAPEKGQAESLGAVIDLCTRGRKRGYCAVLATQRLSKLHKDAAAECNNKLIGRTGLDIDLKRAGDELGLTGKDSLKLRDLTPGSFFVFGPAIAAKVEQGTVGQVKTHHPKAGRRQLAHTPAPTDKIKKILGKFADLPQEAEAELQDKVALKAKVRELEGRLRSQPGPIADEFALSKAFDKGYTQAVNDTKKTQLEVTTVRRNMLRKLADVYNDAATKVQNLYPMIRDLTEQEKTAQISEELKGTLYELKFDFKKSKHSFGEAPTRKMHGAVPQAPKFTTENHFRNGKLVDNGGEALPVKNLKKYYQYNPPKKISTEITYPDLKIGSNTTLGKCERAIYSFLASRAGRPYSRVQVAVMTGYRATSGGFNNAVARLNTLALIEKSGSGLVVNQPDLNLIDESLVINLDKWKDRLGACERKIYSELLMAGEPATRDQLAEATGYSATSGGFNNAVARLHVLGLIKKEGRGIIVNPEVLDL